MYEVHDENRILSERRLLMFPSARILLCNEYIRVMAYGTLTGHLLVLYLVLLLDTKAVASITTSPDM